MATIIIAKRVLCHSDLYNNILPVHLHVCVYVGGDVPAIPLYILYILLNVKRRLYVNVNNGISLCEALIAVLTRFHRHCTLSQLNRTVCFTYVVGL